MPLHSKLGILRKFLKGTADSRLEQRINQWYYSIDDATELSLWSDPGKKKAIASAMNAYVQEQVEMLQHKRKRVLTMRRRAYFAAAAVFGGCLIITAVNEFLGHPGDAGKDLVTVTAPLGKVRQVLLPDSSIVWLKSGTSLSYTGGYGERDRQVEIKEGEAYFDVRRDDSRPFLVHTGNIHTKVLGTAFNIQFYGEEPLVQIWVEHGKVQVTDSLAGVHILTANQRFQWNKVLGNFRTDSLRWQQALAWQKGVLLLQSASFAELAMQLKEVYGVRLMTADAAIHRQLYDAKFFIRTPIASVLQVLSEVHHIHYRREKDALVFY